MAKKPAAGNAGENTDGLELEADNSNNSTSNAENSGNSGGKPGVSGKKPSTNSSAEQNLMGTDLSGGSGEGDDDEKENNKEGEARPAGKTQNRQKKDAVVDLAPLREEIKEGFKSLEQSLTPKPPKAPPTKKDPGVLDVVKSELAEFDTFMGVGEITKGGK